jgi:hypothetical protein
MLNGNDARKIRRVIIGQELITFMASQQLSVGVIFFVFYLMLAVNFVHLVCFYIFLFSF